MTDTEIAEERRRRLQELRQAIEAGKYRVPAEAVAEKLLSRLGATGTSTPLTSTNTAKTSRGSRSFAAAEKILGDGVNDPDANDLPC